MSTNAELVEAADIAIRSIKPGNAEQTITAFATALNRPADARALSDRDVKSIANKLIWTQDNIARQVYRLARVMVGILDDAKA
jgi:hypothetical protein